ncbi:MAG TPA: Gfo/Idh/MocA family oxidoreductase, partial [Candidatus Saccharimonadales bacterium]|nr:Gfo/Idh/MocA family oxidoreductase [Candidatus Saccharimonadales bacterium]
MAPCKEVRRLTACLTMWYGWIVSENLGGIIIGFGNMGHVHQYAMDVCRVETLAIIDNNPKLTGEPAIYPSLEVYDGPVPDLVIISSPTYEHIVHTQDIIDRFGMVGLRGVLLEKPPVRTVEEVARLRELSRRFGHIMVGEVEHYNPALGGLANFPGRPLSATFNRQVNLEYFLRGARPWFLDESKSGGIVLDMMIHD